MAENKDFLRQNGKKKEVGDEKVASNLGYLTGIIDLGTQQQKKFNSDEYEGVRMCKLEFEFPQIERTYGDGKKANHIKSEKMKLSSFQSSEGSDYNNAKLVDVMLALGAEDIPEENEEMLSAMKEYLNMPLLITSVQNEGNDENIYDKIVKFSKIDADIVKKKKLLEFEPTLGNNYFDFNNFSQEDFDDLQSRDKKDIKETEEYIDKTIEGEEDPDEEEDADLPF